MTETKVTKPRGAQQRLVAAMPTVGAGGQAQVLGHDVARATEQKLGLKEGAIGTTHTITAEGAVVDKKGIFYGLSASAPGGFSNWMKELFLDYALGGAVPGAATANLWVALLTGTFTAGTTDIATLQNGIGGASAGVEVVTGAGANQWNNYQRAQVANNSTTFPASSGDASTVAATQVAGKHNGIIIGNGAVGAGNNSFLTSGTNAAVTGTGPTPTMWAIVTSATLSTAAVIVAVGPITSGNTPVVNGNTVTMAISALFATIT